MQRQPKVLVITLPEQARRQEASECLDVVCQCLDASEVQRAFWDEFCRESVLRPGVDLLIPIGLPDPSQALDFLRWLDHRPVRSAILAVLPRGLEAAKLALAVSCTDELVLWPESRDVIGKRVSTLLAPSGADQAASAYQNLVRELGQANLVGQDPIFLRTAERISACAHTAFPILITGETGTGKETFARAIHFLSERRNHPFIPVDCAGLPDHLLENELFGHARGAYTDAYGDQRGLAALADGGTLFLDEIDSLSLAAQAKFLRFLQERRFKPLGSERFVNTDVKIVAASNRNLEQQTAQNLFRPDLYYRLNVLTLELPPLRERPQDIGLLAQHFLKMYLPAGLNKSFSPAALNRLSSYHWPGNVRELLNMVQRAIAFSNGPQIKACDIAIPLADAPPPRDFREAKESTVQAFERDFVHELLQRHAGNITHAAQAAGKERRAFGRLVKKYGLAAGSHSGS